MKPFPLALGAATAMLLLAAGPTIAGQPVADIVNIPKLAQDLKLNQAMMQKTKEVQSLNDLMKQTLGTTGAAGPQRLGYLNESSQLQDVRSFFPNVTLPDGTKVADPKSLGEGRAAVRKLYFAPKSEAQMTPALQQAYEKARSDSERRAALDAYGLAITNRNSVTKAEDQMQALAEKAAAAPNFRADIQANHAATIASVNSLGRTQAALAALLHVTAAETLRKRPIAKATNTTTAAAAP